MKHQSPSFTQRRPGLSAVAREPATILVATDGTPESDHALQFARAFTHDDETAVHVLSVCEPGPDPVAWPGLVSLPVMRDPRIVENSRRDAVRAQIERIAGDRGHWPLTVTTGAVSDSIATSARDHHANLIVTGRGRRSLGERLLGEEHLLRLIRESSIPVLAADDSLSGPLHRIAVGIDFGEGHRAVAQGAARWAAEDATVFLVHARHASPPAAEDPSAWFAEYDDRARTKLQALIGQLDYPPGTTFEVRLVNGNAGVALSEFCETEACDLVVAGGHSMGFLFRLIVGSTATYLLRHAKCSLLTIPIHR
jgi:nucleotide-binding universal stress UspA family protein